MFAKRIVIESKKLKTFIRNELKKGKKIYLYGASTRGNTILQFAKLGNQYIKKAVERNKEKWGKTFGVHAIPIISEEQGRKEQPDYMVVLPWFFKEEFIKREKLYLQNGGTLLFPLPTFHLVKQS
jgi:D-arabinose 1-dehydrogenase-like Zn-dependent alcohol dehydrogenase